MDTRCVEPLLRFSPGEFHEAYRRARHRAIAVCRAGSPTQDFEQARAYASLIRWFEQLVKGAGLAREMAARALRNLLGTPPLRVMPLRAPLFLPDSAFSEVVCLTHAPHAPPSNLQLGDGRISFDTVAAGARALMP